MSKKIRPLSSFKKVNPGLYERIAGLSQEEATSKKGKENSWYWWFGALETAKSGTDSFIINSEGNKTNIGTVSELGRLILTGWYYDIEDWAKQISVYVYNSYHKKRERGDAFNDLEFKKAVKHIRENIGYYYHKEQELKLYILETFFQEEIKPLLPPPPELLKKHERGLELIEQFYKNKSKDRLIDEHSLLDSYWYYLSEILDSYNIPYLSLEEFKAKEAQETAEYMEEIKQAKEKQKAGLKNIPLSKYLKGDK